MQTKDEIDSVYPTVCLWANRSLPSLRRSEPANRENSKSNVYRAEVEAPDSETWIPVDMIQRGKKGTAGRATVTNYIFLILNQNAY